MQKSETARNGAEIGAAQLVLELRGGTAQAMEPRSVPRLDLIDLGLRVRAPDATEFRRSPRFNAWASDTGRVWSLNPTTAEAAPWRFVEGLYGKRRSGHVGAYWPWRKWANRYTIVADAFHGPKPKRKQICHGNGNAADDRAANLRYDDPRANYDDAVRHGTRPARKLTDAMLIGALLTMQAGESDTKCARRLGVTTGPISHLRSGRRWPDVAPCLPRRATWRAIMAERARQKRARTRKRRSPQK